jgi:hypothetical protein
LKKILTNLKLLWFHCDFSTIIKQKFKSVHPLGGYFDYIFTQMKHIGAFQSSIGWYFTWPCHHNMCTLFHYTLCMPTYTQHNFHYILSMKFYLISNTPLNLIKL